MIFIYRFHAKEKEEEAIILFADDKQERDGERDDLVTLDDIRGSKFPIDSRQKEGRVLMLYEKVVACAQQ
jgi:hypothetical protein